MRVALAGLVVIAALAAAPAVAQDAMPADLTVTASTPPGTVDSLQPLVLTVVVTNHGANPAPSDLVLDMPHVSAVEKTAGDWHPATFSGAEGGSPANWYIAQLAPGETETLTLTFRLKRASRYSVEFETGLDDDPNPADDRASGTLDVRQ